MFTECFQQTGSSVFVAMLQATWERGAIVLIVHGRALRLNRGQFIFRPRTHSTGGVSAKFDSRGQVTFNHDTWLRSINRTFASPYI